MSEPVSLGECRSRGVSPAAVLEPDDLYGIALTAATIDAGLSAKQEQAATCSALLADVREGSGGGSLPADDVEQLTCLLWRIELAEDDSLRRWFMENIPPWVAAAVEFAIDIDTRPAPLQPARGPFRCGHCGEVMCGDHIESWDRTASLDSESLGLFSYCFECVRSVLAAASGED